MIRAMNEAACRRRDSITFVGTVGEEGPGRPAGRQAPLQPGAEGPHRPVRLGRRRRPRHHAHRRRQPPLPGHVQGPGRAQLRRFGLANPIHALGRAIAKIAELQVPTRAEDDVQRRPDRRRHVGELDRLRGLDGSGYAVRRQGGAHGARRRLSQERRTRRSPRRTTGGGIRGG